MRRFALIGLAVLAVLGMMSCGSDMEIPDVGIVYDSGGLGDKSFNDSAHRGMLRAEEELGINFVKIESEDEKDYEANLRELAASGASLVIAVGINMQTALEAVAKEYPDTKFAIIDANVELDNVRALLFKEEEGSFLVGYLAGLMTETDKIGFVGGMEIDLIKKFQYGYLAGATLANPDVELLGAKYTGDWNNIDNAKVAANTLYSEGADIIYHAAGRAGLGVIRAAADNDKWAIGVDSDQDGEEPGHVLTSMIKRVDVAVFQTIKDLLDGEFTSGQAVYDLSVNGVGISDLTHTRDIIGEEKLAMLEEVSQNIIQGTVKVPNSESSWRELSGQ